MDYEILVVTAWGSPSDAEQCFMTILGFTLAEARAEITAHPRGLTLRLLVPRGQRMCNCINAARGTAHVAPDSSTVDSFSRVLKKFSAKSFSGAELIRHLGGISPRAPRGKAVDQFLAQHGKSKFELDTVQGVLGALDDGARIKGRTLGKILTGLAAKAK